MSRYLKHLPREAAAALLPDGVGSLARLFPALGRVEAVAASAGEVPGVLDPQQDRRQAVWGVRRLLGRLAAGSPVVLFIDDLQWSDRDSAEMLAGLLAPPGPPALLLVGCTRDDGGELPLRRWLSRGAGAAVRELKLRELWFSEACELALELLGDERPQNVFTAQAIARKSGGNPSSVVELARGARAAPGA